MSSQSLGHVGAFNHPTNMHGVPGSVLRTKRDHITKRRSVEGSRITKQTIQVILLFCFLFLKQNYDKYYLREVKNAMRKYKGGYNVV